MSYQVFFGFSVGLSKPMLVPNGTLEACQEHVNHVTRTLGFKVEKYRDNPAHWLRCGNDAPKKGVSDETYCKLAVEHNRWVRWLYRKFGEWAEATAEAPPKGGWERRFSPHLDLYDNAKPAPPETMTPEEAQTFWHGLTEIHVPTARWTSSYYRDRMEHAYEVLRGRESEGVTLNAKKLLSPRQAAAVICLFSDYIDPGDLRLDVPNGCDHLASSSDGGYDWCATCGPVLPEDGDRCRRKGCDLRSERGDLSWVLKDKAAGVYLGRAPDAWPAELCKAVLHFTDRDEAVKHAEKYAKRGLVVVPVGKR